MSAAAVIFAIELALLFTHEMDAVRRQEWQMFIILKDMADEKAFRIFMLLHIPLYAVILSLLLSDRMIIAMYITDIFLILHMLIHFAFTGHKANQMNGGVSKAIIYSAGLLALVHLPAITL